MNLLSTSTQEESTRQLRIREDIKKPIWLKDFELGDP